MADEMVERVAKALTIQTMKIAGFWATLPTKSAQDRAVNLAYFEALPLARAAIEEIAEPTNEMVLAGGYALQEHCALTMMAALQSWKAMAAAALTKQP